MPTSMASAVSSTGCSVRPPSASARSASRREPATGACLCRAGAWRRSSSTSAPSSGSPLWPGTTAWPAPSSTGPRRCPDELFHRFPAIETAEIHLATGFQNALYEHPAFPAELRATIHGWCVDNCADERKPGETETQFIYKTRKKALGPFKRTLWELPVKDEIIAAQEAKIGFLMEQLAVQGTTEHVARYVRHRRHSRPMPESLAEQVTAAT